jgi:hypothetical protein
MTPCPGCTADADAAVGAEGAAAALGCSGCQAPNQPG